MHRSNFVAPGVCSTGYLETTLNSSGAARRTLSPARPYTPSTLLIPDAAVSSPRICVAGPSQRRRLRVVVLGPRRHVPQFRSGHFGPSAIALLGRYEYAYLRQGDSFDPIPGFATGSEVGRAMVACRQRGSRPLLIALWGAGPIRLMLHAASQTRHQRKAVASIGVLV